MLPSILHILSIWIIVIPVLVGIMNFKGLNKDSKWIFLLVVIALVPQVLTATIAKETALLNLSYNLYTPVEFGILYAVFLSKYRTSSSRLIMQASLGIYLIICSYFFISFGLESKFLNGLVCANNIIYMLWILLLLKQEYSKDSMLIVKGNAFTWYLISIIIYAPSTLIVFALYYYIRDESSPVLMNLWIIQSICNILLYLLFSTGLLIRKT
ncbi:MAG: hypothetical protein JWR72_1773 [Flavisolibacter sp.]|jgi:hypothetical protein|nr:hypothetical protein [Flavisolibacter sp.]